MYTREFIAESNRIEGIHRPPTEQEVAEYRRFMALDYITVEALQAFVRVYQPGAVLRDRAGLDVRVGPHVPIAGGPAVRSSLEELLSEMREMSPYEVHCEYETIHPFTDGNGRSGRMLWAWQMREFPLGFLHHFYYQALQGAR